MLLGNADQIWCALFRTFAHMAALQSDVLHLSTKDVKAPAKDSCASEGDRVIPGDYLGSAARCLPGAGTYLRGNAIFSTLVGSVTKNGTKSPRPHLSVIGRKTLKTVPNIGSVAICRVLNVSQRQAKLELICVDNHLLPAPLSGVLRKEDVRAVEKDSVDVFGSFRPGDIVRARVITPGESHAHYGLSTASNDLGVVMATSERGFPMGPASWCEMQCSQTGARETRKVAKVKNAVPIQP